MIRPSESVRSHAVPDMTFSSRRRPARSHRITLAAVAALTLVGLGACSDSDDDAADATTSTSTSTSASASASAQSESTEPVTSVSSTVPFAIAPEDEALCAAAERIAAGDAQLQERLQTAVSETIKSGEIDPLATLLSDLRNGGMLDGIDEAYADLQAAAPADQQENVRVLAEFTRATFEDLEQLDTVDELQTWFDGITSDPDAIAAQEPARAIGEHVREHCGISLTS